MYGILADNQVGIDPLTCSPRIAEKVLQEIRQYLLVPNGESQVLKELNIKKIVAEVEKDPIAMRRVLSLEPPPIISQFLDKGKGLVFNYESSASINKRDKSVLENKLMSNAIKSGEAMVWKPDPRGTMSEAHF